MNTEMSTRTLLEPHFQGERFQANTLPLSLLRDLEALQEVVRETAKALYRERNPTRKRLPRGFGARLELHLEATEKGSFIAKIGLILAPTLFPQADLHLALAREACDKLTSLVGKASLDGDPPLPQLPPRAMRHLERFGQGLQEGESISLGRSRDGQNAVLTSEVRRRILMASPDAQIFHENVQIVGRLTGIKAGAAVTVRLPDEREVEGRLDPTLLNESNEISSADVANGATWVQVEGVGCFDRSRKLLKINEISLLDRLDEHAPQVQLARLSVLRDGWLDGEGKAPTLSSLNRISAWFDTYLEEDSPLPRIYPTPEGGIEAEWLIGRIDLSIEFDPSDGRVEWHAMNLDSNETDERTFRLGDASDMHSLGGSLMQLLRNGSQALEEQKGELR